MAGARQPIELIKAKGNKHLTKKEINDREKSEIKAPCDKITPPSFLSKDQKKKFVLIADQLQEIGIMSNLDCDILSKFVVASDMYEYLTERLFDEETRSDIFELEKVVNLQDKYYKQCLSISKELGLTISSRCKLVMPKKEEKENPLIKVLQDAG